MNSLTTPSFVTLLIAACTASSPVYAADAGSTDAPASVAPITINTTAETARTENASGSEKKSRRKKPTTPARPATTERGKPVVAHSALQDGVYGLDFVHRGMSATEVEARLGQAAVSATPEVWIYWDYRLAGATNVAPEYDTLLVSFQNGVVVELRLVNSASLRALLDRVKR